MTVSQLLTPQGEHHAFHIRGLGHDYLWRSTPDATNDYKTDSYHQRNVRRFLHILASPGYAPATIAVNVTWMKRGFNACKTHRSMYPSIFFPVIQPVSSKVRHFSTFLASPWTTAVICYMDGKRIQCWSNASQHIPIYLQPFTSYSEILVGNCNFFLPPLAFNALVGGVPTVIPGKVWSSEN